MDKHRIRNVIPPIYAVLILLGFLISSSAGLVILIVGGALSGILWSALSAGGPAGPGGGRNRNRNRNRSGRR